MGGHSSRVSNSAKRSRQSQQQPDDAIALPPQRSRAAMLQSLQVLKPSTLRATFEGGQFGHYTPGLQSASGANGAVRRYVARAGESRQPGARRPEALAVKTFRKPSQLQLQRRVAFAVHADPVLRRLVVPAMPLTDSIVMPWLRRLVKSELTSAPGAFLSDVWHQTRAALDQLVLAGHGYFDLKMANLVMDGDRVVLCDIAGVYVAGTGPALHANTFAFPCHSGFVVVDDAQLVWLMRLCGDWAMLQLAWDLLGLVTTAMIKEKKVYALLYGAASTLQIKHVLQMVRLIQDHGQLACAARGADPAILAEPTLGERTVDLMVAQLERMKYASENVRLGQIGCCVAYVEHFPKRVEAAERLREVLSAYDSASDSDSLGDPESPGGAAPEL